MHFTAVHVQEILSQRECRRVAMETRKAIKFSTAPDSILQHAVSLRNFNGFRSHGLRNEETSTFHVK